MSSKLNILLPVEILNRELDCTLFLACLHAEPSIRIFVGPEPALMRVSERMLRGLVVGAFPILGRFPSVDRNLRKYRALKDRGFVYVQLAAEGAIFRGSETQWRELLAADLDPALLQEDDYVCTWGGFQRDFYREQQPACANHIRATGHPRFDLLKDPYRSYFDGDVAALRSRYGDFVLINTNASLANSGLGIEVVLSEARGYSRDEPEKRMRRVDRWAHQSCVLANVVRLVHRASTEFPETNFIIRPHPSERRDLYRVALSGLPNVEVLHEGSVIPWLLACRVMLHEGCTTGLEAYLGGANVINFKPIDDPNHHVLLSNSFGVTCRSEEAVLERLQQVLVGREALASGDIPSRAYDLLANFRGDAFGSVRSVMEEAVDAVSTEWKTPRHGEIRARELPHTLVERAKRGVRRYSPSRDRKWRYQRGKFWGFDREDLERRVDSIGRILGKKGIRIGYCSEELFSLESA